MALEAAEAWSAITRLELTEDLDGDISDHPDLMHRGYELGQKALARLEAQ